MRCNGKYLVALSLLSAACQGKPLDVPFYRSTALTPEWLDPRTAGKSSMHHVASFTLSDQNGQPVSALNFRQHATVIHFFFTSCAGVCPTTQTNLARLLRQMSGESRVQILSHSVTPERDSIPALRAYAEMHEITDPRWHLLTGARDSIESLARTSYFVNLNNGASYGVANLAHTETLVLVDVRGRLRGMYTGSLPLDIERLGEDIRSVLKEAD